MQESALKEFTMIACITVVKGCLPVSKSVWPLGQGIRTKGIGRLHRRGVEKRESLLLLL